MIIQGRQYSLVFDENITQAQKSIILRKLDYQIKYCLSYRCSLIINDQYDEQWKLVFAHMIKCQIRSLYLAGNSHSIIMSEISRPFYENIHTIDLGWSQINNIEQLQFLNASSLQGLGLDHNNITCLKSINKLYLPRLTKFFINFNYAIQFNINRLKHEKKNFYVQHSKEITQLDDIQYYHPYYQHNDCQNVSNFVFKNEVNQVSNDFTIIKKKLINEEFFQKVMTKAFIE